MTGSPAPMTWGRSTTGFLETILPRAGAKCVGVIAQGRFNNLWGPDADWVEMAGGRVDARKADAYFALAGFDGERKRKQANVVAVRCLWLDIDTQENKPKELYIDRREAVQQVVKFSREVGMPRPTLVSSGYGLHVYFVATEDMSGSEWKALAGQLKQACLKWGLAVDPSRTTDEASVLRVPGTHNHKRGEAKAVRIAQWGDVADVALIRQALDAYVGAAETDFLADRPPYIPAGENAALTHNGFGDEPTSAHAIAERCGVLKLIRDTRGNIDEPTWYAGLGVLRKTEEAPLICHAWSDGHRDYSPAATDAKLAQLEDFGPTTCERFRLLQPEICGMCTLNVKSPIVLGREPSGPEQPPSLEASVDASRLTNLLGKPYKRQLEAGDWLVIGEITVVNSPGGCGKTSLLACTAISLASGRPLLGLTIFKRRRVLFENYEETTAEGALKFEAICRLHGVSRDDLGDLHYYGSDTVSGAAATTIDRITRQPVVNEEWISGLRRRIQDTGAEVVFLDPYSAMTPYGMNDNGLTYMLVRRLKTLAAELGCAIVISAHTRKGGTAEGDGAEAVMGAAALTNGARVVLGLRRVDEATAKAIGAGYGEEGNLREVIDQKANFAPIGSRRYFKLVPVQMDNATPPYPQGDWVAVFEPFTPQAGARSLPVCAIKDGLKQLARGASGGGEPYCQKKGPARWFGHDLAAVIGPHMPGLSPRALEAAARELVAEGMAKGWIESRSYVNSARKNANGLCVVWSATDWANEPPPTGSYVG